MRHLLLIEPDHEVRAVYAYHVRPEVDAVVAVPTFEAALEALVVQLPHVVVYNAGSDWSRAELFLRRVLAQVPNAAIISVGETLPEHILDKHMSMGVRFHINRYVSHPRDLQQAVRQSLASIS